MMRELRDVLNEGFAAHAGALAGLGTVDALTARAVASARRRRTWRAAATGAVSVAAVSALAVAAVAAGTFGGGTSPAYQWAIDDPYALGPCTSFIPANGAVLPEGEYAGRAYVDPAAGFVVAVMPDGTMTRVQPGPDGDYAFDFGNGPVSLMFQTDYPVVIDSMSDGSGGGGVWVDADPVGWDWTLEPIEAAPAGVNSRSLSSVLPMAFGFGGSGYSPGAVPDGAVAEVVAIYVDGHEVTYALVAGGPGPSRDEIDHAGLEAVALRVTLGDGQVWEIRADYTPENVPNLPCQPTPPSGPRPAPTQTAPSAGEVPSGGTSVEPAAYEEPLSGPESAVYQCGAALPAVLEGTVDVRARRATGNVSISQSDLFRVGDDGLIVEGRMPMWTVSMDSDITQPLVPGWFAQAGGQADGSIRGNVSLIEVVGLRDGVIVAAATQPVMDSAARGAGNGAFVSWGTDSATATAGFMGVFNGIHALLVPCSSAAVDLTATQLAVVYGFGPDAEHMTYGWTLVAD